MSDTTGYFPSIDSLLDLVYQEGLSAEKWREIGTRLELKPSTLDEIEWAHPRSPTECLLKMLNEWLRYDETATLEKYKKALSASKSKHREYSYTGTTATIAVLIAFVVGIGLAYNHHLLDPVEVQPSIPPPLLRYSENIKTLYKNQPEVPGIEVLWYNKIARKFISPVFYKLELDLNQRSLTFYPDESKQLHFDSFFRFTGLGQRILIQGRPGSGKTTLVNRLTKEWLNQTEDSKIAKCPLLLRVTLRELRMERPSGENLSLLDILSMNYNIMHIDKELNYLSEPKNANSLCIIFDGLDEYPPAYSDPSNYIYKIIVRQQLSTATVIVLSRPEAYETFLARSDFQAYELTGFNSKGVREYVTRNIPDQEHAERFLTFLEKKPSLYQLCTIPLHLTMFVESVKDETVFPSSLMEAYTKSISKSFKREIRRKKPVGCSNVRLTDLSSLRVCNSDLADTIINASRLAFDGLVGHDRDVHFSVTKLHSYLPFGDHYGLLSPVCHKNENVKSVCSSSFQHILFPVCHKNDHEELVCSFSFPHSIIQEFWAAFHVKITKKNISDVEEHIITHSDFLYFVCGSNTAMIHEIFENLIQWHILNDYTTCGLESGHSIQSLADRYLKFHDMALSLDSLSPFSPRHMQAQYFFNTVHLNITHIFLTPSSPSLRLYIGNRTDIFPNLEKVSIMIHLLIEPEPSNFYCPSDFRDNLRLFSRERSLPKMEWIFPLKLLLDQKFLNCLDGIFDTEIVEMTVHMVGSFVEVPNDMMKIYESCHYHSSALFSAVKLTPDTFITALANFTNFFHKLAKIRIEFYTPISCLGCQQIQALFEALYNSSFYNKMQSFEMFEICNKLSIENIRLPYDKTSGIARIEQSNGDSHSAGNSRRTLYLTSGLLYEDWRTVTNFYIRLRLISKFQSELCTNKQMRTYFS